jgi:single-stranded DNA-binding protein
VGADIFSLNKVILVGQAFRVGEVDTKKSQIIRLATSELFIYGKNRNPKPTTYYHLVKTTRSLAEYCAKYIVPGDLILVEGRLRNFPSRDTLNDTVVWKSIVWADKVVLLSRLESLKDDLKEKFKSAIDKK